MSTVPTSQQQQSSSVPRNGPTKFVPRPTSSTGSSGFVPRTQVQQQRQQQPFATNPNPIRVPNPQFSKNNSQNQVRASPPPATLVPPSKNVPMTKPLSAPTFSQPQPQPQFQQTPQVPAVSRMVSFAEDESVFSQRVGSQQQPPLLSTSPESAIAGGVGVMATSGSLSLLPSVSATDEGIVGGIHCGDEGQKKKGGALNVKTTAWIIGSVVVVLIMIAVIYTIMRIKKNEKELKKLKEKEVPVMDPDDVKYLIQDFIENRPEDLHRAVSKHALVESKQKQQQALQQAQQQQLKLQQQQQQEEMKKQENIAKLRQQQHVLQQALLQQQQVQQQQKTEDVPSLEAPDSSSKELSKDKQSSTNQNAPLPDPTSTTSPTSAKAPSTTGSAASDPTAGHSSSSSTSSAQQQQQKQEKVVDPETVSLTQPVTIDPIGETSVDEREVDGMPEKEYLQRKRQEQQDSILQEAKRKAEAIKEADRKNREKREKEARKREVDAAIERVISINRN